MLTVQWKRDEIHLRVESNHICVQLTLSGCTTTLAADFHILLTKYQIHTSQKLSWIVTTEGGGKAVLVDAFINS